MGKCVGRYGERKKERRRRRKKEGRKKDEWDCGKGDCGKVRDVLVQGKMMGFYMDEALSPFPMGYWGRPERAQG